MKRKKNILYLISIVLFVSCASDPLMIVRKQETKYSYLGSAQGSACGSLLLLDPAYYFIPIMINSRVDRAYRDALSKYPGARSLVNVTISEEWYWYVLGTARCTVIQGDAIK